VGPERSERAVCLDQPEEVVETPGLPLLVQWVAFEVEEDVARIRSGNRAERGRVGHLPCQRMLVIDGGELESGLQAQRCERAV
jgi:hypothetical protein